MDHSGHREKVKTFETQRQNMTPYPEQIDFHTATSGPTYPIWSQHPIQILFLNNLSQLPREDFKIILA